VPAPDPSSNYWCCAQHETGRERLALYTLGLNHYETYLPRIRARRMTVTRKLVETASPLFPGYVFIRIVAGQWWAARRSAGIARIILDGERPAVVPDAVIDAIKAREVDGLVQFASPPPEFSPGDRLRIVDGALAGQLAVFKGMKARERIEVLLILLGAPRRVEIAKSIVRLEP
jgi:transcriptional antiterminator RfaH